MKLTKLMRQAFVRAAMDDVPKENFEEHASKVLNDWSRSTLPPKVQALLNDKTLAQYVNSDGTWVTVHNKRKAGYASRVHVHYTAYGDFRLADDREPPEGIMRSVRALMERQFEQEERLETLRAKLEAAANSVTTRKALVEMLPEFEKYLPAEQAPPSRMVPVVVQNVVADFVKAGWPKNKKAA